MAGRRTEAAKELKKPKPFATNGQAAKPLSELSSTPPLIWGSRVAEYQRPLAAPRTQDAWDAIAAEEANALMKLLERPDLKVMVIIIGAHTDPQGTTDLIHSVSANTKKSHAKQFHAALMRRVRYLQDRINKA